MLFNSIEFLIYLPIVFILYWFVLQRNFKVQNLFIVFVSYIFYGWWDWRFLILIALTSILSWYSGYLIYKIRETNNNNQYCRIVTSLNIMFNLLILGVFKYYNFFVEGFINAFALLGVHLQYNSIKLVLPVGISFYTFQALSYSIDIYKQKLEPTKDIIAFLAYVSFFPQLVAGPIERATNLLPQFYKARHFDYNQAVDGMRQILWGFFKKVVVADNCAIWVNTIWENYQHESASTLLLGAVYFSFQIYGDFSGYSDIAIGTSKLFGIYLKQNFNMPYFSRDIAEFWRKWHISLTTWFRDYIYIPLGGSRVAKKKVIRNTFIIFLISGLWHGANWTFVVWGFYHACLFIPLLVMNKNRKNTNIIANNRIFPSCKEFIEMITTFLLVVIGWIIFRAENIHQAYDYIQRMLNVSFFSIPNYKEPITLIALITMLIFEWINRKNEYGLSNISKIKSFPIRYCIYWGFLLAIYFYSGAQESFIYFQF